MRRLNILLLVFAAVSLTLHSQPKSTQYNPIQYDFFVNVLNNPQSRIYDFLVAGLNSNNTQLKDLRTYENSKEVQAMCRSRKISVQSAYGKIKASWRILIEVQHTDVSPYGFGKYMTTYHRDNMSAPRTCPNPELKHKLSIVPLALEQY